MIQILKVIHEMINVSYARKCSGITIHITRCPLAKEHRVENESGFQTSPCPRAENRFRNGPRNMSSTSSFQAEFVSRAIFQNRSKINRPKIAGIPCRSLFCFPNLQVVLPCFALPVFF